MAIKHRSSVARGAVQFKQFVAIGLLLIGGLAFACTALADPPPQENLLEVKTYKVKTSDGEVYLLDKITLPDGGTKWVERFGRRPNGPGPGFDGREGFGDRAPPARLTPPGIDAAAAGKAAIAAYDKNGDGVISGDELDKCPAIKSSLKRYDNDGDGKVTAEAIAARIKKWQATRIGAMPVQISLELDGEKLDGATVTLEPEAFLGPNMPTITGKSNGRGFVNLMVDPRTRPGVPPGLYKVKVSKMVDDKETIPARYNTDTELGVEVAMDNRDLMNGLKFKLTSK